MPMPKPAYPCLVFLIILKIAAVYMVIRKLHKRFVPYMVKARSRGEVIPLKNR